MLLRDYQYDCTLKRPCWAVIRGCVHLDKTRDLEIKPVANALAKTNNHVIKIIVNDGLVNELDNYKIDVAFIDLHGHFGEDGSIQKVLESKDIPYTGFTIHSLQ